VSWGSTREIMIQRTQSDPGLLLRFTSIKTFALVSDTHGLLRDSVMEALQQLEVGLIVHAGDVGSRSLLQRLETIAPVVAIRGNVDHELASLPSTDLISVNGLLIYVLHDLNLLDLDPATTGIAMVVSGHSHRPEICRRQGVLYVNPGSIGPRRFHLPVSFAKVGCQEREFAVSLVHLEERISG
jgi:uncharacterized protein